MDCACCRKHRCDIDFVYIEENATARLSEICPEENILVVADENTFAASGNAVLSALATKNVKKVVFGGEKLLVPNEDAVARITDEVGNSELIVGIGSGVIQDLCKYVSFKSKVPYVIVATAPSMDGYASNGAAMITDGMKVTYTVGLPRAIVADVSVLKNAPLEMIKSGYGDIIGKYSALNDWKLSKVVNGEYFCDYIYGVTCEQIEKTVALADGLLKRDPESIKALTEALVVIGIMMSFAGSSRPASGSEHHLSHFFEITGLVFGEKYFPHGTDVAYSTAVTAKLREKLLESSFPKKIFRPDETRHLEKLNRVYGKVAQGCVSLQKEVGNYASDRSRAYLEKEEEIKAVLREMPSFDEIKRLLSAVNFDLEDFYALYGDEKISNAVFFAKDLKDRYTVLWLWYDFFAEKAY